MPGPVVFKESYYKTNQYMPYNITVDMGDQQLGKVGANLSSRMVLAVRDEAGHQIPGFFTENEYNSSSKMFASRFRPTYNDPGNAPFRVIYDSMTRQGQIYGKGSLLGGLFRALGHVPPKNGTELKDIVDTYKGSKTAKDPNEIAFWQQKQDDLVKYLKSVRPEVATPEALEEMGKDPGFLSYMLEIARTAISMNNTVRMHTDKNMHAQEAGANINKRNNAMYDYAVLLGEPDLMARSSSMTVLQGGQTMHGTFMVNAEGMSRQDMYYKAFRNRQRITMTGRGLQEISKLQVMDFLNANFDRHYDNLFYKVDDSDPDYLRIVGVQGIDNDASHGVVDYEGDGVNGYMSRLEDIRIMDAGQARQILHMDEDALREKLFMAGLSPEEIKANYTRLHALQKRIKDQKITLIENEAEWENELQGKTKLHRGPIDASGAYPPAYPQLDGDPNLSHLACNGATSANLFQLAYEACHNFNENPGRQRAKSRMPAFRVGRAVNIEESNGLAHQLDEFREIREVYGNVSYASLLGLKEKLAQVTDAMEECVTRIQKDRDPKSLTGAMLTDRQRNLLSEQLMELKQEADAFAQAHAADADSKDKGTRYALHFAQSISVHAANARQAIRSDAVEAEKTLASRYAEQIRKKSNMMETAAGIREESGAGLEAEYAAFGEKLGSVDKSYIRSSDQFKQMLEAFRTLKDSENKEEAYRELARTAQQYLDYKVPAGANPRLSDYAKSRVQFAKDLKEFAERGQNFARVDAESRSKNYQQDAREVIRFNNNCVRLVNEYTNALATKDPARIEASKQEILHAKDRFFRDDAVPGDKEAQFVNKYRDVVNISKKYTMEHPMQMVVHDLFLSANGQVSAVDAFAKLHAKIYNEKNGTQLEPYVSLNVSRMAVRDFESRLKEAGQRNADKQAAAKQANTQKTVPQAGGLQKK